ncbi:MAG: bifunctional [glutamate--ammonia ligase]-adenylyl-L-tyrosine phosphorylase/[glutamate--ammonia-ligase] adenylyltransferase [Candidatus Binataceae bacterium]
MSVSAVLNPELQGLATRLGAIVGRSVATADAVRLVVQRAPDERLALVSLLKLAEQSATALAAVLEDHALAGDLIFCLGSSEIAGAYLGAQPDWLAAFEAARRETAHTLGESMRLDLQTPLDRAGSGRELAAFKEGVFGRLIIADSLGRLDVGQTMTLMSRLAEECIRGAVTIAKALAEPRATELTGFCVLALGKLGVHELNLSSDVDLAYLFDGSSLQGAQLAAARMGEMVTDLLRGAFRVDLRLRPGGTRALLVSSLEGALSFYQSFGQTWERAALLRARPIAGELELGRQLLSELNQFIYRRYLDFDTLRQLRAMKQQIERELHSPDLVERNIKLGRGGIRELEFIVQALTLVYGGRDPRLRSPETLAALGRLENFGYLTDSRARQLSAAYLFLRDVEHKLQMVSGLQTHNLPATDLGMRQLAARMGLGKEPRSVGLLRSVLEQHRSLVAAVFNEMLAAAEDRDQAPRSEPATRAWASALDPAASTPCLQALGFAHPAESASHLLLLARGPARGLASPRRKELLANLGPLLLEEIGHEPNPDLALMNLAAFIASIGARTSFLSLLEQHPATRKVLMRLFASSQYLSGLFIRHPEMIDVLVRSDLARLRRSALELNQELAELLAHSPDLESRLDALRSFRHQEFLRIAIASLAGRLELNDLQTELTLLAETVLNKALDLARAEVSARFPISKELPLCAIAMGRLGSAEMSYNSDLDLIFVYRETGQGHRAEREAAPRIVQKLIAILESRSREGYAYKLDLRLRPSGNAGPLVTSLDGFREYHRYSSATWERQALIRGRVVAGDERLAAEVEDARLEFVFGQGLSAEGVAEIAAMRERMERELGFESAAQLNIKQGAGGLVDVQFLTQMMALRYGWRYPQLRRQRTTELLAALMSVGLIVRVDGENLHSDYEFLVRLENHLRMETDQASWAVSTDPDRLTSLARRMGFTAASAGKDLLDELARRRRRVREIFTHYFTVEQAREPEASAASPD